MKKLHVDTHIDYDVKSPVAKTVLMLFAVFTILFFVAYPIYVFMDDGSDIKTETSVYQTVFRSIETSAFVVRNEEYVNNSYSGTVVPAVMNGNKVATGDTVANVFSDASAVSNAARLKELKDEINYFRSVAVMSTGTLQTDINLYKNYVTDSLFSLSSAIDDNELSSVYDRSRDFRKAITKYQIAVGKKIDVSDKLTALQSEYDKLKNISSPKASILAPDTGFYVSSSDGFENIISYDDVKDVTCSKFDEIIKTQPASLPDGNVGKLITDFNWYLICKATALELGGISVGDRVTVSFLNSSVDELRMNVIEINQTDGSDELAIVLSSNEMNEDIAELRHENIKIRVEEYSGYTVNKQAIRTVEGETGVYVKLGNIVRFRKINIVYSDDNIILSLKPEEADDDGYLKLYDDIITEGTDLYDGKILN